MAGDLSSAPKLELILDFQDHGGFPVSRIHHHELANLDESLDIQNCALLQKQVVQFFSVRNLNEHFSVDGTLLEAWARH